MWVDDSRACGTRMRIFVYFRASLTYGQPAGRKCRMLSNLDVVRERWPDAGAFYLERDHRTKLEVAHLGRYVHTPIEIHVEPRLPRTSLFSG